MATSTSPTTSSATGRSTWSTSRSSGNSIEAQWEEPRFARFLQRLASFSRLICFDQRGKGLSDPVALSALPMLEQWMDDVPLVLVEDGRPLQDRMSKARVSEDDVLERARELRGLERMDQIKYAVLERSGSITVIPREVGWAIPPAAD